MDPRRIIVTLIGFILAFLIFLVISFYLYPSFNPDAKLSYTGGEIYLYDYASFGPQNLSDMKNKIEELENDQEFWNDATNAAKVQKETGMIFQEFNLVNNLSAINNVLTGLLNSSNKFLSLFFVNN